MKYWYAVFLSSAAFFMSYFSRITWSIVSSYSTLKPTIQEDSIIFSLFFIGYIVVQIPAGVLSDIFSPAKISIMSLSFLSLSLFLSGIANSIELEYLASVLMGLSAGWIYPATLKLLSSIYKGKELALAIGYYSLAWPLSITLSGLILPYISINFGWRASYYLLAIIGILIAISFIVLIIRINPTRTLDKRDVSLRKLFFFDKNVAILSSAGFLFFTSYWIITLYSYKYFLMILHNPYVSGLAYSLLAAAGIPSTIISGYIINRLNVKNTLFLGEFLYGLLALMLGFSATLTAIIVVATLMGFIRFIITPANSTAASVIGKEKAGAVAGTANMFWQSSGVISPLIASFIILHFSYFTLWVISSALIIVSSMIYLGLKIK